MLPSGGTWGWSFPSQCVRHRLPSMSSSSSRWATSVTPFPSLLAWTSLCWIRSAVRCSLSGSAYTSLCRLSILKRTVWRYPALIVWSYHYDLARSFSLIARMMTIILAPLSLFPSPCYLLWKSPFKPNLTLIAIPRFSLCSIVWTSYHFLLMISWGRYFLYS